MTHSCRVLTDVESRDAGFLGPHLLSPRVRGYLASWASVWSAALLPGFLWSSPSWLPGRWTQIRETSPQVYLPLC